MRHLWAIWAIALVAGCRSVSTQVSPVVNVYNTGNGTVTVGTDYTREGDDTQQAGKVVTPSVAASAATGPNATSGEAETTTTPEATPEATPEVAPTTQEATAPPATAPEAPQP